MLPDSASCRERRATYRWRRLFRYPATLGFTHPYSIKTRLTVLRIAGRCVKLPSRKSWAVRSREWTARKCFGPVTSRARRLCKILNGEGTCSMTTLPRRYALAKGERYPSALDPRWESCG